MIYIFESNIVDLAYNKQYIHNRYMYNNLDELSLIILIITVTTKNTQNLIKFIIKEK